MTFMGQPMPTLPCRTGRFLSRIKRQRPRTLQFGGSGNLSTAICMLWRRHRIDVKYISSFSLLTRLQTSGGQHAYNIQHGNESVPCACFRAVSFRISFATQQQRYRQYCIQYLQCPECAHSHVQVAIFLIVRKTACSARRAGLQSHTANLIKTRWCP